MHSIQVTTVHPACDNRIFNKIVDSLVASGVKVTYIAPHADSNKPRDIRDGFQYAPIKTLARGKILIRLERNARAFFSIIAVVGFKKKQKVVHFHDPEFIAFALLLRLLGINVIYDIHEDNLLGIRIKNMNLILKLMASFYFVVFERLASLFFRLVIAEVAYERRFPCATKVLNYPVQYKHISRVNTQKPALTNETINFLYTGVVSKERGLVNHLKLLKLVDNSTLTIVGRCSEDLLEYIGKSLNECERSRLTLRTSSDIVDFSVIQSYYEMGIWSYGLALFPPTLHYRDKELTKLFEYSFHKIPVLYSNFPVWERLLRRIGAGIPVDPLAIDLMCHRLNGSSELHCHTMENFSKGFPREYLWSSQFENLLDLYKDISRA